MIAYRQAIDDLLAWACAEGRAEALFEERTIVDYLDGYRERRDPAPATYHRRFLILRRFMRWVARREGVRDPFVDLDAPQRPRQEADWLTPDEFARMVTTGVRRAELVAVDWGDLVLDADAPSLLVRKRP